MKQTIYLLTLTFGLCGCNNQTKEKIVEKKSADTLQTVNAGNELQDIFIKDKSLYEQIFVDGITSLDGMTGFNEQIKLIDNYILTGKDTTYFPDDLSLNKATTFKATKDNKIFVLTVTRTNLTNLSYNFQITDKDKKTVDTKSGKAILASLFFLASENDEDSQTGDVYGSYQYWDKTDTCSFSIKIGIGLDDNGKKRATLTYSCLDENKQNLNLNLNNCPTLRTK